MENTIEQNISMFIVFGTLLILVLIIIIILFMILHQRKMLKSKLIVEQQNSKHRMEMLVNMNEAQEKERARIADTMHDQVGALLFSAKVQSGVLAKKSIGEENQSQAARIEELVILGIEEMRKSIQALSPSLLEKLGFVKAIEEFVRLMNINSEINTLFDLNGEYESVGKKNEIAIYRIMQEVVNNALKHSKASNIIINMSQDNSLLHISIKDDGIGFNTEDKKDDTGLGLKNIEHRVFLLNGNIELKSESNNGTYYRFKIPNSENKTTNTKAQLL